MARTVQTSGMYEKDQKIDGKWAKCLKRKFPGKLGDLHVLNHVMGQTVKMTSFVNIFLTTQLIIMNRISMYIMKNKVIYLWHN